MAKMREHKSVSISPVLASKFIWNPPESSTTPTKARARLTKDLAVGRLFMKIHSMRGTRGT